MTDSGLITSFNSGSNSSSSSSVSDASTNSSSQLTKSSSIASSNTAPSSCVSSDSNPIIQSTPSVKTIAKSYETNVLPTYSKPKLFQNLYEMNSKRSNSIIKIINGTKNKISMPSLGLFENQNTKANLELEGKYGFNSGKTSVKTPITKYSRHATVNIISDIKNYETAQLVEKISIDDINIKSISTNIDLKEKVNSIQDDSKSEEFFLF